MGVTTTDVETMIDHASQEVGVLWPLDRAVAVNPLLDLIGHDFSEAVSQIGMRLGIDPWPSRVHLEEARRRGLNVTEPTLTDSTTAHRPPTMAERVVDGGQRRIDLRSIVGQILLQTALADDARPEDFAQRVCGVVESSSSWIQISRQQKMALVALLKSNELEQLLGSCSSWSEAEMEEEMARHFARLPGWSAWAKWNDCWARRAHHAGLSRREFLTVSLAVDLAVLETAGASIPAAPYPTVSTRWQGGRERLEMLELAVHGEFIKWLAPRPGVEAPHPRFQIVTCIDVRSEPLRRALEEDAEVETFGFAGFFGVPAMVQPSSDHEAYESLPVLVPPSALIEGGPTPTVSKSEMVAAGATLAELTHEPATMFALAESGGFLATPWLLARSFFPRAQLASMPLPGTWHLNAPDQIKIAEGALRAMGMTQRFAQEVVFLGHRSTTANNPHFAALECGACAGHAGRPNAAALAELLNDEEVRAGLRKVGISIPDSTRFLSGEHDTTRERVEVDQASSAELVSLLERASNRVALQRVDASHHSVSSARRILNRRARDWSEVRPEWGLADHAAFVVAPRASIRGIDLQGRSFLHSYDPDADGDGSILASILAAPMVVAHWINAAYFFSSVAPDVLGAGDKTLHNPVGDFAVVRGDDPDLCLGLPRQSLSTGRRLVHLPVRLLVAVEAPLDRITTAVHASQMPQHLIEGEWVRLIGRNNALDEWRVWIPGVGFGGQDA